MCFYKDIKMNTVKQFWKRAFSEPLKIEVKPVIIDEKKDIWDYKKVHLTIWFVDGSKWEEDSSWFDLDYLMNVFYKKYFESNIDETFFNILEDVCRHFALSKNH